MRFNFSLSPMMRNLLATAGVQIVVAVLSLISGPIQARGLGADGRGQLAVVLIIGQIASFLIDAGTGGYIIRQRAHGRSRGELIGSVIPIVAVSLIAWMCLAWPIALAFGEGKQQLVALIIAQLLMLPIFAAIQLGSSIALGEERWRTLVATRLILATVPVLGLSLLFFTHRLTLLHACICYFAATALSAIPALAVLIKSLPLVRNKEITVASWKFGRTAMVTVLLSIGNVRADALIVAQLLSFRDAGLYVVASTLASLPIMLANAAVQSFAKRLALDNLGPETAKASRLLFAVVTLAALAVGVVSPIAFPLLFGPDFSGSVSVAMVLLIGTICGACANFLSLALSLTGQPKTAAIAQLVGIIVMTAAMIGLSPLFGVVGAAAGSALGYVATLVILIRAAQSISSLPWHAYILPNMEDVRFTISAFKKNSAPTQPPVQ